MKEAIKRRRREDLVLLETLEVGITGTGGHPETGVSPEQRNFHGSKYHN